MTDRAQHAEVLSAVLELTVLLHEDTVRDLDRRGLTTSRAHLLWELHERGPSRQRTLAEGMGVAPRTVTGLLDSLEATGFVARTADPADRRASRVVLTAKGRRVARALHRDRDELAELLFAPFTDAELGAFSSGLARLLDTVRRELAAAGGRRRS